MSKMETKRVRRVHTREVRAGTAALVRTGGRNAGQVARDLALADSLVRTWVHQAQVDAGEGPAGAFTTAEKAELSQPRRAPAHRRRQRAAARVPGWMITVQARDRLEVISMEKRFAPAK